MKRGVEPDRAEGPHGAVHAARDHPLRALEQALRFAGRHWLSSARLRVYQLRSPASRRELRSLRAAGARLLVAASVLIRSRRRCSPAGDVALGEPRHREDLLARVEVHDAHALRRAAHGRDARDARAQHLAAVGHEHHLVVVDHLRDAHHLAVARRGADRDHALAAAVLDPVVVERGALAVAVLRHGQDGGFGREDLHADHGVAPGQRHAAHAARRAAHRPHLRLVEADRLAAPARDDHLLACRWCGRRAISSSSSSRLIAMIPPRRGFA